MEKTEGRSLGRVYFAARDRERGGTGKKESRKERNCGLAGGKTLTKREQSLRERSRPVGRWWGGMSGNSLYFSFIARVRLLRPNAKGSIAATELRDGKVKRRRDESRTEVTSTRSSSQHPLVDGLLSASVDQSGCAASFVTPPKCRASLPLPRPPKGGLRQE